MIVLDASAAVDLLTRRRRWREIEDAVVESIGVAVPGHWRVECVSALRRLELQEARSGTLDAARALIYEQAVQDVDLLVVDVYSVGADELWSRRANLRVADAAYVALAHRLEADLVTSDGRLARTPGLDCEVRSFEPA